MPGFAESESPAGRRSAVLWASELDHVCDDEHVLVEIATVLDLAGSRGKRDETLVLLQFDGHIRPIPNFQMPRNCSFVAPI